MKNKFSVYILVGLVSFSSFGLSLNLDKTKESTNLLAYEKNTIGVFKSVAPSVVNVSNIQIARRGGPWFDSSYEEVPAGAGTGFVWDNEGHIVTNFHVVQGGTKFLITFRKDNTQYEAKVVGAAPSKDIAVLKLIKMPKSLTPITSGVSKTLEVGQKAMAIGNPFGLDHTITSGIISALGRKIQSVTNLKIHGMIQTDTSINPGNSGGPLIDSRGQLIGMNTAIYSASGSSAGVGFAVPVDTIKRFVPELIKHGEIIRPALGISVLSERHKKMFSIQEEGIVIREVLRSKGAQRSGLRGMTKDRGGRYFLGDIITKVEGKKVKSLDDIFHLLEKFKIGDNVKVEYIRSGKVNTTTVKLSRLSEE